MAQLKHHAGCGIMKKMFFNLFSILVAIIIKKDEWQVVKL